MQNVPMSSPSDDGPSLKPDPLSATDQDLICSIGQKRCGRSLEELHRRYRGHLQTVARKYLSSNADCDDVVQESLLQIWQNAHKYDPDKGHPYAWLITITKRRALDVTRSHTRSQNLISHYLACHQRPEPNFHSVEGEVSHNELHRILETGLDELPEDQRCALQLAYYKGMSQRQIAAHLQLPLGTVKTRLILAMKKLGRTMSFLLAP